MIRVPSLLSCFLLLAGILSARAVPAAEPLHVRIDRLVAEGFADQKPAPPCDDAAFLHRVTLDLAGTIPTAGETRTFLALKAPEKRIAAIDRLLAAPTYAARMRNLFHVMLMERRGDNSEWSRFLQASFEQNRSWDQMARAILDPVSEDESLRGAAFFMTKRLEKYGENPTDFSGLTRDVGRMFLGVDLQCAECHDHLFVEDYKQVDFQGLFFVYKNLAIRKGKSPVISQSAMTEKLQFVSVFDPTQKQTGPRIPFGKEIAIPDLPKPEPKKKGKKPSTESGFDPLSQIASEMTAADNEQFNRNIVNRLWFAMMGRGLVMPLDLFHSGNPPSHPKLLDLLAEEFVAHGSDIKWFLRELALTETYQRGSRWPEGVEEAPQADRYLVAHEKRLSAEQLLAAVLQATGNAERILKINADSQPGKEYADLQKSFQNAFANEEREPEVDFNATVKAALFLLNDEKVLNLLTAAKGESVRSAVESPGFRAGDGRTVSECLFAFARRRGTRKSPCLLEAERGPPGGGYAAGHLGYAVLDGILRQPLSRIRNSSGDRTWLLNHNSAEPWEHQLSRRRLLGTMAAGAAGLGAGALGGLLEPAIAEELRRQEKQVVFVWLDGGMSQLESWDPKPNTQFGGPFRDIATSVPGVRLCELLPHTARQMHHLAIVRNLHTKDNSHSAGVARINRGDPKNRGVVYPYLGSAVAKLLGPTSTGMPPYVWVKPYSSGFKAEDAGFLGAKYGALAFGDGEPHNDGLPLEPPENLQTPRIDQRSRRQGPQRIAGDVQPPICPTAAEGMDRSQQLRLRHGPQADGPHRSVR